MNNYSKYIFFLLTVLLFGFGAKADDFIPQMVDVAIAKAYIPKGFDTNDRTQIMIEGALPNSCYRLGATEVHRDEAKSRIFIVQHAYLYKDTKCLMVLIPFNKTVDIGILSHGTFLIIDGHSAEFLGNLSIAPSLTAGPDDYLYAIVDDVRLGGIDSVPSLTVRGTLPKCWQIEETRLIVESDDVITILPIASRNNECTKTTIPFVSSVKIPSDLKKGRYMVQVRSLNGLSVNKLFDL